MIVTYSSLISSKKSLDKSLSSNEEFVCKVSCKFACLACFACLAFFSFSSFSKEIKLFSLSNLFITISRSSSSSFSRRDFFFFLSFFSCFASYISLIVFHSTSRSWMSCNNSTDIKRWFFVISLICLIRDFFAFRAATSFACISSRFILTSSWSWH